MLFMISYLYTKHLIIYTLQIYIYLYLKNTICNIILIAKHLSGLEMHQNKMKYFPVLEIMSNTVLVHETIVNIILVCAII